MGWRQLVGHLFRRGKPWIRERTQRFAWGAEVVWAFSGSVTAGESSSGFVPWPPPGEHVNKTQRHWLGL
jgi:hypothetical protein